RNGRRTLQEFAAWLGAQPPGTVQISTRLRAELAAGRMAGQPALTNTQHVAFYALDPEHLQLVPNEPRLFEAVFGPREVNLNYYPDWIGDEHIVVLSSRQAARFGIGGQ